MGQKGNQFSTFAGVFTPSILTILGVIMFLRAGHVVGEAGIINTIFILCIAETISLLTAISMSAIATNTPVAGGGAYFLISRALGPQFGGAIGLALFLAQALARDRIFPILGIFGHGSKDKDEPRYGLTLTLGLTLGVILLLGSGEADVFV